MVKKKQADWTLTAQRLDCMAHFTRGLVRYVESIEESDDAGYMMRRCRR